MKVWNETVANLTLMALGSSAPEILLSIIEIAKNDFKAGDLGPGTIVGTCESGSARFAPVTDMSLCFSHVFFFRLRRTTAGVLMTRNFFRIGRVQSSGYHSRVYHIGSGGRSSQDQDD